MIRVIIVDDEQDAITYLEDLLKDLPEVEVCSSISDSYSAVSRILDIDPDLIFLDIQMPGKNGIEIIRELKQAGRSYHVVFITAFDKYAIEALKESAFDYLIKPASPEDIFTTITKFKIDRAKNDQDKKINQLIHYLDKNKKLRFNNRTGFIILNSADLIYIESDRNYSTLFLKDNRKEIITSNLGTLEDNLPSTFYRISRFHIINIDYLSRVDRKKHLCILSLDGTDYALPITSLYLKGLNNVII